MTQLTLTAEARLWWRYKKSLIVVFFAKLDSDKESAGTQYSGNICWVFPQRCNVPGIQGTFREHVKENFFSKDSRWKSCFVLKVYDLRITNVDLLANSGNHKAMLPVYLKTILQIYVSKIFQRYPRNIVRLWKCSYEVKKFKKLFCGLSCEIFNIGSFLSWNVFLNFIETVFYWEQWD